MSKERVAFIGIGVMGKSMAGHILEAGYPLTVYNRTQSKADDLVARGATWADSPATAAEGADVVITIVGFPADVEATYFGDSGVFKTIKTGALVIDMTTSSPILAKRIAEAASEQGVGSLDAPVSGGDLGAREARLSIMIGGEQRDFDRAQPLFDIMGKNIQLQGPAGSGQYTKMCNQIAIASGMVAIGEALATQRWPDWIPSKYWPASKRGLQGAGL